MLVPFTCNSGYLNTGGFLESVRSANCVCRGISEEIKSVYTEQTFFMNPSVSNNRIDYVEFEAKLLYLCTGADLTRELILPLLTQPIVGFITVHFIIPVNTYNGKGLGRRKGYIISYRFPRYGTKEKG